MREATSAATRHPPEAGSRPGWDRTGLQILCDRVLGLQRWLAHASDDQGALDPRVGNREHALDARRHAEVRRGEEAALREWIATHTSAAAPPAAPLTAGPRVLVVHPEEHARTSLRSALQQQGVRSVLTEASAPAAIGQCVLEQPDIVVLAAGCQMMTADDAVGQLRRYCPHTLVVVCDAQQQQVATLLEAGADAVYTRPVTRDVICQDLMDRLQD